MIELEPAIQAEYNRVLSELSANDEINRINGLSVVDVLHAHFLIANHFYLEGQGIGGIGPRNMNLLLSTVDRQFVTFSGNTKWTNSFDISATLFCGLIKNHPFHDENKRTAFLSVFYLLYRFVYCKAQPEKEFEDFTVEISDDLLYKYSRYHNLKNR